MKLLHLAGAFATASIVAIAIPAQAQAISDGAVRIGVLTDMSGRTPTAAVWEH